MKRNISYVEETKSLERILSPDVYELLLKMAKDFDEG